MRLSVAGCSALGGRETNQDSWFAGERLIAVADGVGGAPAGEVASRLAVESVAAAGPDTAPWEAAVRANAAVRAYAETDPATHGMATTLVIAALGPDGRMHGAFAGDSVMLVQTDQVELLSTPHTLGAELVAAGHLTAEEGARHPNRRALVRAVGMEAVLRPGHWTRPAVVGERYLLCSDGLTDALDEQALLAALTGLRAADPRQCVETLVRLACEAGARDNVTAVVGDVVAWPT
ncbi:PP2C family protein-serine/threonine phosphatase [Actinokineospora soli]|uniref:PP2C family protein-serine/threonine phosphatase n=1 Tax=Actinokineospora soli TaxID=1048753 RepID=A0ABW2TI88_9PSEU